MGTRAGICRQPLNSQAKSDNTGFKFVSEAKAVNGKCKQVFSYIVQHRLSRYLRTSACYVTIVGNVFSDLDLRSLKGNDKLQSFIVYNKTSQIFDKVEKRVSSYLSFSILQTTTLPSSSS